jgi:hypothetical protein
MNELVVKRRDALTEALAGKVRGIWDAYQAEDAKLHAGFMSADFSAVHPDGSFHTRPPTAKEIAAARISRYRLTEMEAWPVGADTALLRYLAEVEAGGAKYHFVVGEVWVKQGSEWKCRYYQPTVPT